MRPFVLASTEQPVDHAAIRAALQARRDDDEYEKNLRMGFERRVERDIGEALYDEFRIWCIRLIYYAKQVARKSAFTKDFWGDIDANSELVMDDEDWWEAADEFIDGGPIMDEVEEAMVNNPTPLTAATGQVGTSGRVKDALMRALSESVSLGADIAFDQMDQAGMSFDYTLVNDKARQEALLYGGELVTGITQHTQDVMRRDIARWIENDEPLSSLVKDIERFGFDRKRAKLIASTEVTRAIAIGQHQAFIESGVEVMQWRTARDERVCPICGKLHRQDVGIYDRFSGALPDDMQQRYKTTFQLPPAHPRCRCWIVPVVKEISDKDLEALSKPALPEGILEDGFPDDLNRLEHVRDLGGSTGAKLVRDPNTGALYVRKTGNSVGHLREEVLADRAYKAMGVNVPDLHLYETDGGPVKLAKFIPDGTTLGDLKRSDPRAYKRAVKEVRKDFSADALLGNWDVVGMSNDNIMVDKAGAVWRIDNGGSLRYRAQGGMKPMGFTEYPQELWTMRKRRWNDRIFDTTEDVLGDTKWFDIEKQMRRIGKNEDELLALFDENPDVRKALKGRLGHYDELTKMSSKMRRDDWVGDYVDIFSRHNIGLQAAGWTETLPDELKMVRGDLHRVVDGKGRRWDNLRGRDSASTKLMDYINANGGSYGRGRSDVVTFWAGEQAGSSWSPGAMAGKAFWKRQRKLPADTWSWGEWRGYDFKKADTFLDRALQITGKENYEESMAAMHAASYQAMLRVKGPGRNIRKRTWRIWRGDSPGSLHARGIGPGETAVIQKGISESTSGFKFNWHGGETYQDVPFHRITAVYWFDRTAGSGDGLLLGDGENEFLAMMDGIPTTWKMP